LDGIFTDSFNYFGGLGFSNSTNQTQPFRMAEGINDESLLARIRQLEHERDELRKDIEQLCMQQAGPGYLAVATRMHFQRTAGLEQEIESLKNKLAVCTRDSLNLQEELSEAYRIKGQLADLHNAEVSKVCPLLSFALHYCTPFCYIL
jgi:FtsZ-binding cell division protein ZapB